MVIAMCAGFILEAQAYHCSEFKKAADSAAEDWARATTIYLTTAAATATTCALAARTKNKYTAALCVTGIAATAAAGWWMGVQSGRYYDAADALRRCQMEHSDDGG